MVNDKKVAGIICEYNPFHNGHKYQIDKTRTDTGCEYIVCAMSGSMVQRGDVAVYDKWSRCRSAIAGGADLVIELPAYYVLQSAQNFAYGGVELLSGLGIVDILSFGSESGDAQALDKISNALASESDDFRSTLEKALSCGMGYPAAVQEALASVVKEPLMPNDILAANYLTAIKKTNSPLVPYVLKRNVPYHGETASDESNASATAIRGMISRGEDFSRYVPCVNDVPTYDIRNIQNLILGYLRLCKPESLKGITGMEDGLENRLISCAKATSGLDDFFASAISKRYTAHRIRRVVLSAIMGMTPGRKLDYIRVLGFNEKGRELLSEIKKKSNMTIVTKTADFKPCDNSMFEFDILATDLSALCCDDKGKRCAGADYTTSPIVI